MQVLKEDIRGRILTIAKQQFEKKGYSKTSMREIAELAGVGVGNIYNYFTSKDELFHEVVRPVLCALEAMLQEHHGIRGEDIMMMRSEKYLKSCIDEYVSLIDKHRSLMEILLFRAQGSSLERFRENYTDRSTELVKAWFASMQRKHPEINTAVSGYGVKGLADSLAEYGADKVIVVDDKELEVYRTEPYAHALASVINEYKPEIMLVGATAIGRDLGPRVSARVATGLTADCTVLEIGDFTDNMTKETIPNQLLMTRPAFGGNTIATIACPYNRPQMATVRAGVMQKIDPIKGAKAEVIEYNPGFTPDNKYVEILDVVKSVADTVDIADAKILVSGGRGVGSEENFKLLQDLADVLGGTVSCSRAVVENGWLPVERQVGQTGKTVRPNVYFAIGISGAIQHVAGMEESDIIVAINKDETAPIFDVADYYYIQEVP